MINKIKALISTKSFLGSILFALALWAYTNLNDEYHTIVKIPILIKLPQDKAIDQTSSNQIPSSIPVEIKGTGWQLFNVMFFNTSSVSIIDLTQKDLKDTIYQITRAEMVENIQYLGNARAVSTINPPINIRIGLVGFYTVPIVSRVKITPKEGFMVVGSPQLKPDMINISGFNNLVETIPAWYTENIEIDNVFESFSKNIPLSDTLMNLVSLSQKEIKLIVDVQQSTEIEIEGIRLRIKGKSLQNNHNVFPESIKVTVLGGIKQIEQLTYNEIIASIESADIIKDTTGFIKPDIKVPEGIKIIKVYPEYITHRILKTSF